MAGLPTASPNDGGSPNDFVVCPANLAFEWQCELKENFDGRSWC